MDTYKIALLIPTTCKGRDSWTTIKDTYLFNLTLKTFLLTQSKEHEYIFYIGIDADDRIFSKPSSQEEILKFKKVFKNVDFKFIHMNNVKKGHLTKMWNILFKKAYDEGCQYFFQCGDDINFKTKNWINDGIKVLKSHNNIGITGPINNNPRILTQAMVSRKHMEIFGWFFPEEIINWCCDDWYNWVYQPTFFYPLCNHFCSNDGGAPRYDVNNNSNFNGPMGMNFKRNIDKLRNDTFKLAQNHKRIIMSFLNIRDLNNLGFS
jgi:hypothetical protein